MKVRIERCSDNFWYRPHIGRTFTVKECLEYDVKFLCSTSSGSKISSSDLFVVVDSKKHDGNGILKSDCCIVDDSI